MADKDRQAQLIDRARRGEITAARAVSCLSASEELTVLLGIGSPSAMRLLAKTRFPSLPDAWQRIDQRQREIVLAAWMED